MTQQVEEGAQERSLQRSLPGCGDKMRVDGFVIMWGESLEEEGYQPHQSLQYRPVECGLNIGQICPLGGQ